MNGRRGQGGEEGEGGNVVLGNRWGRVRRGGRGGG